MKEIIIVAAVVSLIVGCWSIGEAAPIDADGNIIENTDPMYNVMRDCATNGYFIYANTIYQCMRMGSISDDELAAYRKADGERQAAKRKEQEEWYQKWIKTDEGKAWQKEYREKLQKD
jgi:hypothetical protein